MKKLIIFSLTLFLLTSCGTDFAVRKYTEGRFHEQLDDTERETVFKDTIIVKKLKKGSTIVTRIKSKGSDVTINVDDNNIPATNQILDTLKLTSAEQKQKVARIKSIEKHARISKTIFWVPFVGYIHNASYLKKANKIESKYKVDLSAEKRALRTFLLLSIPFLVVGIILALFFFLYAVAAAFVVL